MPELLFFYLFGAGFAWIWLYSPFFADRLQRVRSNVLARVMMVVPLACLALVWYVLDNLAASDVRNDYFYIVHYLLLGALWIGAGEGLFRLMGISIPFDVIERANPAAFAALTGGMLGLTLCFSGSNIGEGPGDWAVWFTALLATLVYALVWFVYTWLTQIDYAVTMHRDLASGIRLGGFLIAAGLIIGRAAVGNWSSESATIADMIQYGSPVLLLLLVAIVLDYVCRPTATFPARSAPVFGVLPALLFIAGAVYYLSVGTFPA